MTSPYLICPSKYQIRMLADNTNELKAKKIK